MKDNKSKMPSKKVRLLTGYLISLLLYTNTTMEIEIKFTTMGIKVELPSITLGK